jgi:hypothetical protein
MRMENAVVDQPSQVKVADIVAHCPSCDHDLFEKPRAERNDLQCASCGEPVERHELLAQIARWALFKRDS